MEDIYKAFEEKDCKIINIVNRTSPITYICSCGKERSQTFRDFKRRNCRNCKTMNIQYEKVNDIKSEEVKIDNTGEVWKRIQGGWISSFGRAKNLNDKILTLCQRKFRYNINGKHHYASRLVAINFKINNHEKLDDQSYCVHHKDNDQSNNRVDNLIVITKKDIGSQNGKKSRKSDLFKYKQNLKYSDMKDIQSMTLDFLPNLEIFANGEIYNKSTNKFLVGSISEKYIQISHNNQFYKVHRLICFAFKRLDNKPNYEEYEGLTVNHIDGNPNNNQINNLEWNTKSENMIHAYKTGLNKKVRTVIQIDPVTNKEISEYISIAEASRKTGDMEHQIRAKAQGKSCSTGKYIWKFKFPDETEEYTKKFSSV